MRGLVELIQLGSRRNIIAYNSFEIREGATHGEVRRRKKGTGLLWSCGIVHISGWAADIQHTSGVWI
jgi:hypothetical protein